MDICGTFGGFFRFFRVRNWHQKRKTTLLSILLKHQNMSEKDVGKTRQSTRLDTIKTQTNHYYLQHCMQVLKAQLHCAILSGTLHTRKLLLYLHATKHVVRGTQWTCLFKMASLYTRSSCSLTLRYRPQCTYNSYSMCDSLILLHHSVLKLKGLVGKSCKGMSPNIVRESDDRNQYRLISRLLRIGMS